MTETEDARATPAALRATVCYALPGQAWLRELDLPEGATAAQAIEASGFRQAFADTDPLAHGLALYGQPCAPDRVLREGDRVEILRPLVFDPKESRRRRAEHRRQAAQQRR